jgi:sigma-B regulation protein RsbU (phosphoserine phosphatase)
MSKLRELVLSLRKRKGLLIVIVAALLLELLSIAQYYFTRNLMEENLEKHAEMELTLKAILIKSTLRSAEDVLQNHIWDIRENLSEPDSIHNAVARMISLGRNLRGGSVAFVPNYYPSKGRLYEPYVQKTGDSLTSMQIAGENHDYTERDFYRDAIAADDAVWVEPYIDSEGAQTVVTSYAMPVRDKSGELAGVCGIDVSLEWLSDTINNRHIYPSSFLLLLTESGKPIIRPSEDEVKKEVPDFIISLINDSTVTRKQSRSGRSRVIHFDTDSRDGTVFYANMKGKPHWQLAVVCYDDEVYAPLMRLRLRLLLLSMLAVGILLFMIRLFAQSEKKLKQKTLEQERTNGELRIANNIQQALLPTTEESQAITEDVCVEGRLIPAKAVGGDLYNAFVRDGKLFFCIGDVSGKGIPSALIMAITQTVFRNIASRENNPAQIMKRLNEAACRNNKANIFVTLFIGVLDLPTGHLRYCNAGHEKPILVDQLSLLEVKPNLPIGLFEDFNYEMQTTTLQPGSSLFLYTDGLTEARNAKGKLFGRESVLKMIADCDATDPKQLVETAIAEVKRFSENTEQSDDLTLLALRYTPSQEKEVLSEELTLHNDVKEIEALGPFVKQIADQLGIAKSLAGKLRLAVEEAVVNVMEYAYPSGKTGEVKIRATSDGHRLKFIITDSGVSFDPTEVAAADTTLSAEERPIGGLGILLVRELMDSINYERIDGKNVLTLCKGIRD